ncbi:hypothetical protein F3Y22_tig00002511pilonHSYRG00067 [Hibiscus syriacus]|uniref:Uncharacterized protein n=1 Tax=Hibiscus syriacus TaxID=106335 RepID=A0A6A3CRF6_HIBSY|nr:hypothetical protein F3Y22_tig00002511pilonHSYRG00067 [Hibiscus syriacus]
MMTYFVYAKRRDEFLTNDFVEILPLTNFNIPVFPDTLLQPYENSEASEDVHQAANEEIHQPDDEEEPIDPDPFYTVSPTEHREDELQLVHVSETPKLLSHWQRNTLKCCSLQS